MSIVIKSFHTNEPITVSDFHIAVCTLEKAVSMCNKALLDREFNFSLVMIDEVTDPAC